MHNICVPSTFHRSHLTGVYRGNCMDSRCTEIEHVYVPRHILDTETHLLLLKLSGLLDSLSL